MNCIISLIPATLCNIGLKETTWILYPDNICQAVTFFKVLYDGGCSIEFFVSKVHFPVTFL